MSAPHAALRPERHIPRTSAKYWELNARYIRYCLIAVLLSLFGHALYLTFGPAPQARPYQLPKQPNFEPTWVEDLPVVPPPPPKVERPPLPSDLELTDEPIPEEEPLPATTYDPDLPLPPPRIEERGGFVVYEKAPVPIRVPKPAYPSLARHAHAEGRVKVRVTIDEVGRVVDVVVVESNAIDVLRKAAVEAAYQSLFKPALQRDVPVKARIELTFIFSLR